MSIGTVTRTLAKRARREARTLVGRWPSAARRLWTGEFPTGATEICIEGFLRSGNTFAVIAFQHAQRRVVSIAHHVHAAGAVIEAVRLGTPTIVLIRPPEDSVLSYVVRWPELTIAHALRGYVRFYEPLVPHRRGFVVAPFGEVTSDLGAVICRVNERFGTAFESFEHTDENLRAVREEMARWDADTHRKEGAPVELAAGLPTEAKEARKARLRIDYARPAHARLRRRAEALYERLSSAEP